jgi:hypothetical protein
VHLSFYPIGAGVFTGAAFALVASAVIALLVAVGYLPEIKYDVTQWGETEEQGIVFSNGLCMTVTNMKALRSGSSRLAFKRRMRT